MIKDVPAHISASHLPKLLQNNTDDFTSRYFSVNDFTLLEDLKSCPEHGYALYLPTQVGDLLNFTRVCDENLIGGNPTATTHEIYDGGVFLGHIIWRHVDTVN